MKKSIVILMALFALAFGAEATGVSSEQAKKMARVWLTMQGKAVNPSLVLFSRVSTVTLSEAKYYSLKLDGGGTVITSADDTQQPVVVFTDSDVEVNPGNENSPLYAFLVRDAQYRNAAALAAEQARMSAVVAVSSRFAEGYDRMVARNREDWRRMIAKADEVSVFSPVKWYGFDTWYIPTYTAETLCDVRVDPLLRTRWGQSTVGDKACYNWYTPNSSNPSDRMATAGRADNAVCGCVATAIAQTLRYFEYPDEPIPEMTLYGSTNSVGGYNGEIGMDDLKFRLPMQGGVYDWASMPDDPAAIPGGPSDEQCMAIGKLTSDCGIAVNMQYGNTGSGSYSSDIEYAMERLFGYESVVYYSANGIGPYRPYGIVEPSDFPQSRAGVLQKAFYSNLDAGLPVIVGLTGHLVVADGYGYSSDGLDYVHLNMGWDGQCDLWYLLPNVSCDANGRPEGNLMFFTDCIYNIFTSADANHAVMSGRVLDVSDEPLAGATVTVFRHGEAEPFDELTTGENGIWGLVVPTDDGRSAWDVVVTMDGMTESLEDVVVGAPGDESDSVGNSWGNDVVLAPAAVRNLRSLETYSSLDKAIAESATGDTLSIFAPTRLRADTTIAHNLTVAVGSGDALSALVRCVDSATLTIASGVTGVFQNVVFDTAASTVIKVAAGGVAGFSGMIGVGTIETAAEDGFRLDGAINYPEGYELRLRCAASTKAGQQIGTWSCPDSDRASVNRLLNPDDLDLGGVCRDDGSVVWGIVPVDPRIASVYAVVGSVTNYYRTLDQLFAANPTGDLDIRIIGHSVAFNSQVEVTGRAVSIRSEGEHFQISPGRNARFSIGDGGRLVFADIEFSYFKCERFIDVADGGELTLDNGAMLWEIAAIGDEYPSGPIMVMGGTVNVKPGASIRYCSAKNGVGKGGAITLFGGTLNLTGGKITNCHADSCGGAIYFDSDSAVLNISGEVMVRANRSGTDNQFTDDIYIEGDGAITVTGPITAEAPAIGVRDVRAPESATVSNVFAAVTGSVSDPAVFFHDEYAGLVPSVSDGSLIWVAAPEDHGECDPLFANAVVTYADGGTAYYGRLQDAFGNLSGDAVITLDHDEYLDRDITIGHAVTLDGKGHRLIRRARCKIAVVAAGELSLKDIEVCGYDVDYPWEIVLEGLFDTLVGVLRGSNQRLFDVNGGRLVINDGVRIHALGADQAYDDYIDELSAYFGFAFEPYPYMDEYDRASCAVVVYNRGELEMNGGEIYDCWNMYDEDPVNHGAAGGILIENSVALILGGSIHGCKASCGAAVDVCQAGVLRVSGSPSFIGNSDLAGDPCDLMVEDLSKFYIEDGGLSGANDTIGFLPGVLASEEKITQVLTNLDTAAAVASARCFVNDITGSRAVAVCGDEGVLLVWAQVLSSDDCYHETLPDGEERIWTLADGQLPLPKSVSYYRIEDQFGYDSTPHCPVLVTRGCSASGDLCRTNAGVYVVTFTPDEGYEWLSGGDDPADAGWHIRPSALYIYPNEGQFRYFGDPEPDYFPFTAGPFYGDDCIDTVLTGTLTHDNYGEDIWSVVPFRIGTLRCVDSNYEITSRSFNPDGVTFYIDNSKTNTVVTSGTPIKALSSTPDGKISFGVSAPAGTVFEVWSTESLTVPFRKEREVVLEHGDSFEIENDSKCPSKFFKIIRK